MPLRGKPHIWLFFGMIFHFYGPRTQNEGFYADLYEESFCIVISEYYEYTVTFSVQISLSSFLANERHYSYF